MNKIQEIINNIKKGFLEIKEYKNKHQRKKSKDEQFSEFLSGLGLSLEQLHEELVNDTSTSRALIDGIFEIYVKDTISISKKENCPDCSGTMAKNGDAYEVCTRCNGSGQVRKYRRTILGEYVDIRTCDECFGEGERLTKVNKI